MKKLLFGLLFSLLFASLSFGQVPTPIPGAGEVKISPASITGNINTIIAVAVMANTGNQKLASYTFKIAYNTKRILLYTEQYAPYGVYEGADGFITSVDASEPGVLLISGTKEEGINPGDDLHMLTINFTSDNTACGSSIIDLSIINLTDVNGEVIGTPADSDGEIITSGCYPVADVNFDGTIDIIDALLVAQYSVGLDIGMSMPESAFRFSADVNCDGPVDIIDALLIAQYYVGMDITFCRAP